MLPPRQKVDIPKGENVEEVDMMDEELVRSSGGAGARAEAYDADSDDEGGMPGGQRVQCAHQ